MMKQNTLFTPLPPPEAITSLLEWYHANGRDLPWRRDITPYRVWISEIMLQQTRVEAVKPYFRRFLQAFPDVNALANAEETHLLKLWEGLGYYNRVRNMQKAAVQIMTEHSGQFPQDYDSIRRLSGIGDYTAGAVSSICFGLPEPAVDGNVLRVMARLQEDYRNILSPQCKAGITAQLRKVYPHADCGMLTQALMELGAMVCVPNGAPHCGACPLAGICMARQQGSTDMLPVREKKINRRTEERTVFVLQCGGRIAIRRRKGKGLLASLWELPNTEGFLEVQEAVRFCEQWGVKPQQAEKTVEAESRIENLNEFISITTAFDNREDTENLTLSAFLAEVALFSDLDQMDAEEDSVTIMTMPIGRSQDL